MAQALAGFGECQCKAMSGELHVIHTVNETEPRRGLRVVVHGTQLDFQDIGDRTRAPQACGDEADQPHQQSRIVRVGNQFFPLLSAAHGCAPCVGRQCIAVGEDVAVFAGRSISVYFRSVLLLT